jgi:hypothetical protein
MIDHPRAAAGLKGDLRAFADSLDISAFQALSTGVGTGEIKKRGMPAPIPRVVSPTQLYASEVVGRADGDSDVNPQVQKAENVRKRNASRHLDAQSTGIPEPARRLARFFFGHCIDLIFSAIAVVSMLSLAAMVTQSVGFLPAIQLAKGWIGVLAPLERVATLYGTFLLYGTIFQVFVGGTIGSQLAGAGAKKQPVRA